MKKFIIILFLIMIATGCTAIKIDDNSYDDIINNIVNSSKKNLHKEAFNGFSFYIPKGLKVVSKDDYNVILSDKYNNYYYTYIDVVSYYNKTENTYKEDSKAFFSKKITSSDNKKDGYLEINEKENGYFVEGMYNYAKIEVYTKKSHLNEVLMYLSEVLSSVKYNKKVIETTMTEEKLYYTEENFNIFETKKTKTRYLDYVEKYDSGAASDNNVKNKVKDDDIIDVDINEE